ncbi:MAG: CoA-binding protein [Deltaproteobacteria bacterium]|nr:CoA-binding protein [Deltaproteobacteria bacterium]
MNSNTKEKLDKMFNPRGLAVFGGVSKLGSFGNSIVMSLLKYGYKGKLYPISPKGGEVAGLKVYKSLDEIKEPIDLASISVPAKAVPEVLEDCLEHGVAGAEIHTSGFAETGDAIGIKLQEKIAEISSRGLRIVGPNCFGLHSPTGGITLLPGFDFSKEPGNVAMISQSGGIANDFGHEAIAAGLKISKIISFGNGCDLEASALLEYLGEDKDTAYIAAYLEGVQDGRKFLDTVKSVSKKKPVLIWKGGLTPLGARATLSHTGSLGGESKIWEGAITQAGALSVKGLDEIVDTLSVLAHLKTRGKKIAIAGGGGAIGVFSSDLAHEWGLEIPAFSHDTQKRLREFFPTPGNSVVNPLDTGTPMFPLEWLSGMIREILIREPIDVIVLIMLLHPLEVVAPAFMEMAGIKPTSSGGEYLDGLLTSVSELKKETGKDIALVLENRTYRPEDLDVESVRRRVVVEYQKQGIPVFSCAERALRGIRNAAALNS